MLIAALDSTAITASAAVAEINEGRLERFSVFTVKNKLTHSELLLPLLEKALTEFGADIDDIDLFSVSAGPGSFTGVRIGAATIKGLAFAQNKPCASVSTLEALAKNVERGIVCPVMDARRDQFYTSLFENGARIYDDEALAVNDIYERIKGYDEVVVCGDGALKFKELCGNPENLVLASPACRDQNALSVAICGYEKFLEGETISAKELKPIYLRIPQAEREKLEREKQKN